MSESPLKAPVTRILLGQIASVHGVRGDVVVRSYTAVPEAVAAYGPLSDRTGTKSFTLRVVRVTDKGVVAHIAGVDDRTAAEQLRGTDLFIARDKLPKPTDDEFYHADLIGLTALSVDGTRIGSVIAVQNFGAGDLIELRPADGEGLSRDSTYIPFTKACVPAIDFAAGTITIVLPELVGEPEPTAAEPDES